MNKIATGPQPVSPDDEDFKLLMNVGSVATIPGNEMVELFLERMKDFSAAPGRELFAEMLNYKAIPNGNIQGINKLSVAELVKAIYLDLIQEASRWAKFAGPVDHTQNQWKRMVRGWDDHVDQKTEQKLFSEVVQETFEVVHDWVNRCVKDVGDWNVWYIRCVHTDIQIEKGQDYRILDWERRMKAGADYIAAEDAGDEPPPEAWKPDAEARRFAELLTKQQREESLLGQSSIDKIEGEKRRVRESRPRSTYRRTGSL